MSDAKPESKERKMLKGDIKLLDELVKAGATGVPIQFLSPMSQGINDKYGELKEHKLPRLLVLERVDSSYLGPNTATLVYRNSKMRLGSMVLSKAQEVRVLSGTVGAALRERYAAYQFANLGSIIALDYPATLGADPEIFVVNKAGAVIPAFDFLPSKSAAVPPEPKHHDASYTQHGLAKKVYWDGFQAEFEVHPGTCLGYLGDSIRNGLYFLYKKALKHDRNAKLSLRSVVSIPVEQINGGKPEHIQFGCAPSYNLYGITGEPLSGHDTTLRFAGGHIHIGLGPKSKEKFKDIIRALDQILGVACVAAFAAFDNPLRRKYYGLAGEYRKPPHGLEYRTLSNAWLCHPTIYNLVFDTARQTAKFGYSGHGAKWQASEKETVECIQNCDVALAKTILERNKGLFCGVIKHGSYATTAETAYNVFHRGIESAIKDPTDIVGNWRLEGGWTPHSDNPAREVNWSNMSGTIAQGGKV